MHRQLIARNLGAQGEVQDGLRQQAVLDVWGHNDAVPECVKRCVWEHSDSGDAPRQVFGAYQMVCWGVGVQVCPVLVWTPLL